jgi:hypothetical protein
VRSCVRPVDTNIDSTEQVRRRDYVRDTRAASAQGLEIDEYRAKRDQAVNEWAEWFHATMKECRVDDPAEILPQAMAMLQERAIAAARSAAKTAARDEVKKMLRKVIAS